MPDSQLHLESEREPSVAKAQNYMGGTAQRKTYTGRGGNRTYFDSGNNWVGEKHKIAGGGHRTILREQARLKAGWLEVEVPLLIRWPVIIVLLRGSILQAETCQILSLAENQRWSPSVAKIAMPNDRLTCLMATGQGSKNW